MNFSVRFIRDFEITIAYTSINEAGELSTSIKKHNIFRGEIYSVKKRNVHPNTIDLFFSDDTKFDGGVAMAVPKNYCEFLLPSSMTPNKTQHSKRKGCGGCGR